MKTRRCADVQAEVLAPTIAPLTLDGTNYVVSIRGLRWLDAFSSDHKIIPDIAYYAMNDSATFFSQLGCFCVTAICCFGLSEASTKTKLYNYDKLSPKFYLKLFQHLFCCPIYGTPFMNGDWKLMPVKVTEDSKGGESFASSSQVNGYFIMFEQINNKTGVYICMMHFPLVMGAFFAPCLNASPFC